MSRTLTQEFVEGRIHPLIDQPKAWNLQLGGKYYELDLKMCQLKSIAYGFDWGKESGPVSRLVSIIDAPSRILKLDISLNELTALEHEGFLPFTNLRQLNASLNKINKFIGLEVLKQLYSLDLSHNFIRRIENLVPSVSLVELNLAMNELEDMSFMPSLINLQVLNVNNNKLTTLEGVQALPKLRELYAQRNEIKDLVPLTSCFHLQILNAGGNKIHSLHSVVGVLGQMKRLEVLTLVGNPVERERMYQTDILKETNVMTLDNISVRPLPKNFREDGVNRHVQNINSLKAAAQQAFEERMRESEQKMEENVNFLRKRILDVQNGYLDYKEKLKNDLEACLRYLDSLTSSELSGVDRDRIRDGMGTPHPKPWQNKKRDPLDLDRADYSHVKDTDELLKCVHKELNKDTY